jgi:hypothetical protein
MKTIVYKKAFVVVLGLAIVILMQLPVVNAKDPVTRPFHIAGQITFLDGYGAPPWTLIDQGVASKFGKFVDVGKYDATGFGFGIFYADNGDQIFWKDEYSGGTVIKFTGGTGQFQEVTGGFTASIIDMYEDPGPEGTYSYILVYEGEGTISNVKEKHHGCDKGCGPHRH